MKKKFIKQLLFPLLLLLTFIISVIFLFVYRRDERLYTELTAELLKNELLPNTLNMHYTMAYPENYGIYSYKASLPEYSKRQELFSHAQLENYLYSLSKINADKLKSEDAYTLDLLISYLKNSITGASFLYYDEPLSPGSGMQNQLPILLAEYTFRSKRDVEDYLAILDQTDNYFNGLILYEQEKSDAGLFMPNYSAEKVRSQCKAILDADSLNAGTHFLQTTFEERLQELYEKNIISEKEMTNYMAVNNRLLSTVMLPAYEALSDALFLLEDTGVNPNGLAHYPDGKAYYEYLVYKSTGSSRSLEDIKSMLYQKFDEEYRILQELYAGHSASSAKLSGLSESLQFPLSAPDEMLKNLFGQMTADFPYFPLEKEQAPPLCEVKAVAEKLEPFSAPAFYLTPPLDDSSSNVIYINKQDCPSGLELYTTLAHEGYPGHLYQAVYFQLFSRKMDLNPVRELMWYGGYLEGWALYTEFLSYDYAMKLMEEKGYSEAALVCEAGKHNRSLQLCLYSILDIAIHYDGASPEDTAQLLSSFGIRDPLAHQTVYQYIVEEPANYLKYYLGYLEILILKEKARALWSTDYEDRKFHQFFLECGPSDFENLEKRLGNTSHEKETAPVLQLSRYSSIICSR